MTIYKYEGSVHSCGMSYDRWLCTVCDRNGLHAQTVHGSQLGLLYGVLNGQWVLRLLPRLVIVSCSGSSMGTNRKWPMATWIVTPPTVSHTPESGLCPPLLLPGTASVLIILTHTLQASIPTQSGSAVLTQGPLSEPSQLGRMLDW